VADRAFADADWLRQRLREVEEGRPRRAKEWGIATFERADLYVRWAVTADRALARRLEKDCGRALIGAGLWNRGRL
jgi:phage terminase Nu1 subunit (DNA packaging protein)